MISLLLTERFLTETPINMKKTIVLSLIALVLFSCKSKEDEKEAREMRRKAYQKEAEIKKTKTFLYLSEIVSLEKEINLGTVKTVVNEYMYSYQGYYFDDELGRMKKDDEFDYRTPHPYDFIIDISTEYKIERAKVLTIFKATDDFFKFNEMNDNIESISLEIGYIEGCKR